MKKAILINCLVLISANLLAQWSTVGSNLFNSNTGSGYVAIGLDVAIPPTSKLHVKQGSNSDWATYIANVGGSGKGLRIQAAGNLQTAGVPLFQVDDNYGLNKMTILSTGVVDLGSFNYSVKNYKLRVVSKPDTLINGQYPDAGFKGSIFAEVKSGNPNTSVGVLGKATQTGVITQPSIGVAGIAHQEIWAGFFVGNLGYTGNFGNPSDIRLKESIEDLDNSLQKILELKPKTFSYKQNLGFEFPKGRQAGFLAQELQKDFPSLIIDIGIPRLSNHNDIDSLSVFSNEPSEKYLAVNYINMIPYIIKAIQEQNDAISKQAKLIELLLNTLSSGDQNKKATQVSIFPNPVGTSFKHRSLR